MEVFFLKVDGRAILKRRKQLKMTQNQLAEGICKQATISNIEKKNKANSMSILVKLCNRLDLPISEITKSTEEADIHSELHDIHCLIQSGKVVEADRLACILSEKEDKLSSLVQNELNLYQGYLEIFYRENESKGLFYLHKVVLTEDSYSGIYRVLANTALLRFYTEKQMFPQAHSYLEDVLDELANGKDIALDQRMTLFYYEGANYYLEAGEFQKGYAFCEQGIAICIQNWSLINLDKLVAKKAELLKELIDSSAVSELDFAERLKKLIN